MRHRERLRRLERKAHPEEPPRIFVHYVTDWRGAGDSEFTPAAVDALWERCARGYADRTALPQDGAWELRQRIMEAADPKAVVEGMTEEEFGAAMSAIGYFVSPGPKERMMIAHTKDSLELL